MDYKTLNDLITAQGPTVTSGGGYYYDPTTEGGGGGGSGYVDPYSYEEHVTYQGDKGYIRDPNTGAIREFYTKEPKREFNEEAQASGYYTNVYNPDGTVSREFNRQKGNWEKTKPLVAAIAGLGTLGYGLGALGGMGASGAGAATGAGGFGLSPEAIASIFSGTEGAGGVASLGGAGGSGLTAAELAALNATAATEVASGASLGGMGASGAGATGAGTAATGAGTGGIASLGGVGGSGLTAAEMAALNSAAASEVASGASLGAAGSGASAVGAGGTVLPGVAGATGAGTLGTAAASAAGKTLTDKLTDPRTWAALAAGVGAGALTARENKKKIGPVGFQGKIDPNRLKYNRDTGEYTVRATGEKYAAGGGIAGLKPNEYKAGGRYLSGPGDGMSDNIKANIDGQQEARLADGEFVIPADVVSHIGNGSSNAGAKKLHAMMNRIRHARTGNPKQGKQIKPEKYLPA